MDAGRPWATFVCRPIAEAAAHALDPREAALVSSRAVEKRLREIRAGRAVAHEALRLAGCAAHADPILKGDRGQPLWPLGWVGTITHSDRLAAALVAPRSGAAGVGIDLESLARPIETDITDLVARPEERPWLAQAGSWGLRALFSAKEAVYKAVYPLGGVFLEFHDVRVRHLGGSIGGAGAFEAEFLRAASPRHPVGSVLRVELETEDDHVLTRAFLDP